MQALLEKISALKNEIDHFIISDAVTLENYRIHFLGTKGVMKNIMSEMKNVSPENKKDAGQKLNEIKQYAEAKFEENKIAFANNIAEDKNAFDFTLPGKIMELGSRHPISIVMNKMISIFEKIGFTVAEGQEIEDDWRVIEFSETLIKLRHVSGGDGEVLGRSDRALHVRWCR